MGRIESREENVKRLYPQLLAILKDEHPADACCALCSALTVRAWNEGYCLDTLLALTGGSLIQGWRALEWGVHDASPDPLPPLANGKEEDDG